MTFTFKQYVKTRITEMRPFVPGESMTGISISKADREAGSPRIGDMIARNPENHADLWLVAEEYFLTNYKEA